MNGAGSPVVSGVSSHTGPTTTAGIVVHPLKGYYLSASLVRILLLAAVVLTPTPPPLVPMPRWSMRSGQDGQDTPAHNTKVTEHDSVHVVDPEEIQIGECSMREYTLFNPSSGQTFDNDSLSSRSPSIAMSTLSIVSRLRNRIFNRGHASPRHRVLDNNDASSFYSGASSTGKSTSSTSTIATITAPSFPPTPPSRPLESTFPPTCTIPLTEIHNHTGTFYYHPTTSSSPRRLQIALPSSSSRCKPKSLRSTHEPHDHAVVTTAHPAIFIVPPENVPAEVYLPSISMNTPRHSRSSIPPSLSTPALNAISVARGAKTGNASRSVRFLRYMQGRLTQGSLGSMRNPSPMSGARRRVSGPSISPPLDSSLLDRDRLSASWLDREVRAAQALREEKARKAHEEATQLLELNLNHYRAPIAIF